MQKYMYKKLNMIRILQSPRINNSYIPYDIMRKLKFNLKTKKSNKCRLYLNISFYQKYAA